MRSTSCDCDRLLQSLDRIANSVSHTGAVEEQTASGIARVIRRPLHLVGRPVPFVPLMRRAGSVGLYVRGGLLESAEALQQPGPAPFLITDVAAPNAGGAGDGASNSIQGH